MLKRILFGAMLALVSTAAIYPAAPILKRAELGFAVSTTASLKTFKSTEFTSATRLGFYAADDSPRLIYTSTNAACTLNSGAGDDGSQVALADGKCAVAALGTNLVPEIWGCVGDGSTVDTPCLQKAVNAVQGTGRSLVLDRVYAYDGTVHVTKPIHITGPAIGPRGTMTMPGFQPTTTNLTLLSLDGSSTSGSTLENFGVRPAPSNGINTSGAAILVNGSGTNTPTDLTIQNLLIWSPCFGIDDQGSNESYYARNRIMAVYGTSCAGIRLGFGTTAANTVGPRLDQNAITCNPANDASKTGRAGMLFLDAGGAYVTNNDVLYCVHGTEINPGANQQIVWPFFNNTVGGDTSHQNDIYINTSATTALVLGAQFTSSWSSNAGSQGLYSGTDAGISFDIRNDGGGLVRGISILGHRALAGGGAWNSLNIWAGDDITVSNSVLCPSFNGSEAAVGVGSAATDVKFIGNRIGACYQPGAPYTVGGGLSIAAGAGVTMIVDNDFSGANVPIGWTGLPSPNQALIIKDNIGIDTITPAAITPAASITLGFGPIATFTAGSTAITTMLNTWANRQVFIEPNGTLNFATGGNICNAISSNTPILATWNGPSNCWLMK